MIYVAVVQLYIWPEWIFDVINIVEVLILILLVILLLVATRDDMMALFSPPPMVDSFAWILIVMVSSIVIFCPIADK